jgi:hypothetical protein
VKQLVNEGKGRLFKRKDGKYLIYIPKDVAEDSMFPFKDFEEGKRTGRADTIPVKVSFKLGEQKLIIERHEMGER